MEERLYNDALCWANGISTLFRIMEPSIVAEKGRRYEKRGLIGVLVLALVSFMLPVTSLAVAAGELTIELTNGGDPVLGTSGVAGDGDYYYNGNVLYINSDTAMTLSGTAVADRIVICAGVAANLTFSGLTITSEKGALEITDGASANITLVGANSLTSGGIYAGILVPQNSALTIAAASTGSLNVTANQGAGIGVNNPSGSASYTCGTVNIYGGTVIASSTFGAAIGCGYQGGNGGAVTISGPNTAVTAKGATIADGFVFVPDIGGHRMGAPQGSLAVRGGATLTIGNRGIVSALTTNFEDCMINGDGAGANAGTYTTYSAVQTGGASGTADSTGIQITFGKDVTGLTVDSITVTDDTGAVTAGTLSGSGKDWTLALSSVVSEGNIKLDIADWTDASNNFYVSTDEQTVAVYKNTLPPPTPADGSKNGFTVEGTPEEGRPFTLVATGDRQNEVPAVIGDERYIPKQTGTSPAAVFTENAGRYTAQMTMDRAGEHSITVIFQLQRWDGNAWVDVNITDTKSANITVQAGAPEATPTLTPAPSPTESVSTQTPAVTASATPNAADRDIPRTGHENNALFWTLVLLASGLVSAGMLVLKKKSKGKQ